MNLFKSIRKKETMSQAVNDYFKMINSYVPSFTTFEGSIWEMELTRSAIHSFATHVSKLRPQINGSNNQMLERRLQYKPNSLMDTKKYLYRLATIYSVNNNVFIAPIYDDYMNLNGYYPLLPEKTRIIKDNGIAYLQYDFGMGQHGAVELNRAGFMNQMQYKDEFFGDTNRALYPTMELINTTNQGIIEGTKNSGSVRFMGKFSQTLKDSDIEKERKKFAENNLSTTNMGLMLFDQKYSDIKQIDSKQFVVNPLQMQQIRENVYSYFGTNAKILQNNFTADEFQSYYEGKIEPFAIEAGLVHTNMTFNEREIAFGNEIMFTADRLAYIPNNDKVTMITQLFDRGFLTHNQGLEILNMAPIDGGDKTYVRKEYALTENYNEGDDKNANDDGKTIQNNSTTIDDNGTTDTGTTEEI